jgi:hypothetical protein
MAGHTPPRAKSILVIGVGELGSAILDAILSHKSYSLDRSILTLMIRPSSLSSPTPEKRKQNDDLVSRGVKIVTGDVSNLSQADLAELFRTNGFTTVIHAGGMTLPPGTSLKLARAVLEAENVQYFMPWQHGADYDIITREGGQGMFSEQIDVRDLLRSQDKTNWVVVSCGVFMSFLFEEFWGVVTRQNGGAGKGKVTVTALNSWDDLITTTTAEDIGTCSAALLFNASSPVNKPVYIAGDTMTYADFADTVTRVMGEEGFEVEKKVWPLEYLREESGKDPEDKIKKYRVVFAEGKGLSWPKEKTWSHEQGIRMEGVEEWMRRQYVA